MKHFILILCIKKKEHSLTFSRVIQVYYQTGRPQSEIIKEQQEHHDTHGVQSRLANRFIFISYFLITEYVI